jgi:predicted nucleic acid-binding protein
MVGGSWRLKMTLAADEPSLVIVDAGPVIALSRIGRLPLLQALFGHVWITGTVQQEILEGGQFADSEPVQQAIEQGWMRIETAVYEPLDMMVSDLDAGELSSIAWASARQQTGLRSLLVLDDARARATAAQLKLPLIGTVGIIGQAKLAGLVEQAATLLWQLPQAGYFVTPALIEAMLRQVGEASAAPGEK